MPFDPSKERYAVFVDDELAERAPVFKSRELALDWLAQRTLKDGYAAASVKNVRQEANRLRLSVRDLLTRAEQLEAATTPNSPKAVSKQRNRMRREASKLMESIAKLNAIRYPGKALTRPSDKKPVESTRGPYSKYGSLSYVIVVSGGLPGLGKKR